MIRRIQFAGALFLVAAAAWGQSNSDQPVCTDLSGKIRVACPGQDHTARRDNAAAPAAVNDSSSQSAKSQTAQQPESAPAWVVPVRASGPSETPAEEPTGFIKVQPTAVRKGSTESLERSLPRNFVADQRNFWTSPLRLRATDANWIVPAAVAFTALNIADPVIERKLPDGSSFIKQSKSFSNYGAAAYAGLVGGAYLWSRATHDDHLRETAVLSGEAAIDTLGVSEFAKYLAGRSRPYEDSTGGFRNGGASFPSIHAADAFAIATVVAHEYPGTFTKLLAYGSASAIAAARVSGRQHFASDVLVGGALGWFIGRQVYNSHSDTQERQMYGTFERAPREQGPRDPAYMGSPYVPLDSWVYSAIDRLAAMGYVDTAFEGMRPWTRLECARMIGEAETKLSTSDNGGNDASSIVDALQSEFAFERHTLGGDRNLGMQVDSVYTRLTGISGAPITDSYHFGQTILNDYGRPYQQGFNEVTGFTAHAETGPFAFFVRGEYQHAPSGPPLPEAARQTISSIDFLPFGPAATGSSAIDRFRLLESYVSLNVDDWQLSAGKQSLWWGPGEGGSMMFSDNAEPIDMVRLSRTTPFQLPSLLKWLGPVRTEVFLGRLSGQEILLSPNGYVGQFGIPLSNQPFLHGQKISFKPTENLEFGFSRTTLYGGQGYPFTSKTLFRSLVTTGNTGEGAPNKPGDRRSGLDLSYRLPKLRNWVKFYADGFAEDEYSPIAYADKSVWRAGLYFSHMPFLPKLDLRTEGVYSDNPLGGNVGPGYYYFNATWRSGYTNNGDLIGDWIGRAGQGAQVWATYHLKPRDFIQFSFRHEKISKDYLPGGGTITDLGVRTDWWVRNRASVSTYVQYEKWAVPVLSNGFPSNFVTSVQFSFSPFKTTSGK